LISSLGAKLRGAYQVISRDFVHDHGEDRSDQPCLFDTGERNGHLILSEQDQERFAMGV
jgi:hypothetical protein